MKLTNTDRMIIISTGIGSVIGLLLSFAFFGAEDNKFIGYLIFMLFGGLVGFLLYFMILKIRWVTKRI